MISNNCNIFRWMEVYPDQMDGTLHIMRYAHDAVYRPFFAGYTSIHRKRWYIYSLIQPVRNDVKTTLW